MPQQSTANIEGIYFVIDRKPGWLEMMAVGNYNERHTIKLSPCNTDANYDIDDVEVIENDVYGLN